MNQRLIHAKVLIDSKESLDQYLPTLKPLHINVYINISNSLFLLSFFDGFQKNPLCQLTLYIIYSLKREKTTEQG